MNKSNKPRVRNQHSDKEQKGSERLGFMQGEVAVPDDCEQIGKDEIATMFEATSISTREHKFNRDEANKR